MKAMIILLVVVLLCVAGQLEAQSIPANCVTPSWVSTAPMEAWMPPLCSTLTIQSFDGVSHAAYNVTVLGYWNGNHNGTPLVYAQSTYNPAQVWLLGREQVEQATRP